MGKIRFKVYVVTQYLSVIANCRGSRGVNLINHKPSVFPRAFYIAQSITFTYRPLFGLSQGAFCNCFAIVAKLYALKG